MTDPRLLPFAGQLGDPALYFVHDEWRKDPLVIEHATGQPRYAIVAGELVPFATYRPASPPPRPEAMRPARPGPYLDPMHVRTSTPRVTGVGVVTPPAGVARG